MEAGTGRPEGRGRDREGPDRRGRRNTGRRDASRRDASRRNASRWDTAGATLAVFALAFVLRLLFWQATPDASWPYPAVYKGDAAVWLDHAAALQRGVPYELGLPLRPPGNARLIAALWDGTPGGVAALRAIWCALGAAAAALIHAAARRGFGPRVAAFAGLASAGSYGLLALSVSLNNETPYLVLVAASLWLWPALTERARAPALAGWAALGALGCLVRVEHALFFAAATAALAVLWWRRRTPPVRLAGRLAAVAALAAVVLAPWHASAWREARRLNREPAPLPPQVEQAVAGIEQAVAGLSWEPEAAALRDRLPAFTRRTAAAFVAATAAVRGHGRVTADDFQALQGAFGSIPEPLPERFFVALYGPLNFYLANNPAAGGGFSRTPLERPPPLAGGAGRYPRMLVAGLPPPDLALTYPPHLEAVNHGYRMGWSWIVGHPAESARLAARKLAILWSGAALGLTGWNLPLGLDGVRRPVDLAVPEGPLAVAWRLAVLVLAAAGLLAVRGRWTALTPWLLFLGAQLAVAVAFFGYARAGATVTPVIALLIALAADRWLPPLPASRRWLAPAVLAGLLLLAAEAVRFAAPPALLLDGRPVTASDPFPRGDHALHRLEVLRGGLFQPPSPRE